MDWNQKYIEKSKELRGWGLNFVVNNRIKSFKANPPIKPHHFSELEYLILNYDYAKSLLKKYEPILSEEFKTKWLECHLKSNPKYSNRNYQVYGILLPFYLLNPETQNRWIDKHFLNDQLLLILGGLDHQFRRYRWRANYMIEFFTPNFAKFQPNFRIRVMELLSNKTNLESIRNINSFLFRNSEIIDRRRINEFVELHLKKDNINPKMAIGYLKRFRKINNSNIEKLKTQVLKLENGEIILNKINHAP